MNKKYTSKDEKLAEANYIAFLGYDFKGNTLGNYLGFSNPKVGAIYLVTPFLNMSAKSIEQNLRAAEIESFGFFAKKNLAEFLKRMDEHLDATETGFRVDYKTRLQAAKDTVAELYPELLKGMEERQVLTMKAARAEIESVLDLYRAQLAVEQEQKEILHRFSDPILTPELRKTIENLEGNHEDRKSINGGEHLHKQANEIKYVPGNPEDKKPSTEIKFPVKVEIKAETEKSENKHTRWINGRPAILFEEDSETSKKIATLKGNHEDRGEEDSDASGKK